MLHLLMALACTAPKSDDSPAVDSEPAVDTVVDSVPLEECDGLDNDGDGQADEGFDADGDGFTTCAGDCDDADAFINPDAPEACDGVDNDCSGAADEAWDEDGDGASPCGGDCDDQDPTIGDLPEVCDGLDNDCDGLADEGFDEDGDGWSTCRGDCDDTQPTAYPGAEELCDDLDNNCDGVAGDHADNDGDGLSVCDGDCDDTLAEVYPGAEEICDGLDNDCSGVGDEDPECFGCIESGDYLACSDTVTWASARENCQRFGADLVVIETAAENSAVGALGAQVTSERLWIGLSDQDTEDTWLWVDGVALDVSSWSSGEPNDSGGEDCAEINFRAVGGWNDSDCGVSRAFICER